MDFEQIYRETYPKLVRFFYARTLSRESAEDLTHEVFYAAVKGANSFSGQSTINTWLFGIAKNKLSRYYRFKRSKTNLIARLAEKHHPQSEATPEELAIINDDHRRLLERIEQLDEQHKEIVTLRVYGELSFKEIGALIGQTDNYARVTFHRIKMQLLKEMGDQHGG